MRATRVYSALRKPRLNYGVSSRALGYIWGVHALAVVLVGTTYGWLWSLVPAGSGLAVHTVVAWMYKKDHRVFEIYGRYANLADKYHPHSRENLPDPFKRPQNLGRGVRL